jgi:WD40 repeat protein
MALSSDNQKIALADDNGEVKVFNYEDGRIQYLVTGHSNPVTAVNFSPDNNTLISGDS